MSLPNVERSTLFLRKASGVVRAWSPLDGLVYNVLAINIVIMAAFTYMVAVVAIPRGNLPLAMVIVGLFCILQAITYSMVAATMPRSGGDYLFQSRLLSGATGVFFAHTAIVMSGAMWLAIAGWFGAVIVTAPFFTLFGYVFNIPFLVDAGVWLATPNGIFVMTIIVVGWAAFVNWRGMRIYALLQRYFFGIGLVGLITVCIMLAITDQATFMARFDTFMAGTFGVGNAYQSIIQVAREMGFDFGPGGWTWSATIAMFPFAAFSLIYSAWGVAHAGEIKRGTSIKAQGIQIVGASVWSLLLGALLAFLIIRTVGLEFLGSAGFLYLNHPEASPLPIPPFYGFFVGVLTQNPVLLLVIASLFFFMFWMWHPNITLAATRIWLAMSFDRVLPAKIGEVSPRTHTPTFAILLFSLIAIVIGWLYAYTGFWRFTLAAALLNIAAFAVTNLGAALLPFRRKEIWKTSPARKYHVAGIPVITICGLIFFGFAGWMIYNYLFDATYGINDPVSLLFMAVLYLTSLGIYLVGKWYRRRQGIDLGAIYKEIPGE